MVARPMGLIIILSGTLQNECIILYRISVAIHIYDKPAIINKITYPTSARYQIDISYAQNMENQRSNQLYGGVLFGNTST